MVILGRYQTKPTRRSCSSSSKIILPFNSKKGLFIKKKKVFPVPAGKTSFPLQKISLESGTFVYPFQFPKENQPRKLSLEELSSIPGENLRHEELIYPKSC
jgi:hypothetical protein